MDLEEPRKPPNTLVLSNALLWYIQKANIARGFNDFEQTNLYSSLALYNRLLAGMDLIPGYKVMKMLYLKSAIEQITNKIQSMADVETAKERREMLPKLVQWSDVLKELTQAVEELN